MYNSEDLERFYFRYQTEALPLWRVSVVFLFEEQGPLQHFREVEQGHP